jgi:hypothetical protein
VVAAAGVQSLLFALLAADDGGDLLIPRPCPAWWAPQARLLGRRAYSVPTPAECGGVPDPYALLETVRRVRAEGGRPRLLLLSVADDPTATVAPPEVVHEACEAAVAAGLHLISDETWNGTTHRPQETVLLSPAEMRPDAVTVTVDLAGSLTPIAWPVAVARFPDTADGFARRARTLDVLTALGAVVAGPVAAAAAHALGEPRAVRVGPLRPALEAHGVGDAMELENYLGERIGVPTPGGHRFGDDPDALRVRFATGPLLGATREQRLESLTSEEPLELPHVERALATFATALDRLR